MGTLGTHECTRTTRLLGLKNGTGRAIRGALMGEIRCHLWEGLPVDPNVTERGGGTPATVRCCSALCRSARHHNRSE